MSAHSSYDGAPVALSVRHVSPRRGAAHDSTAALAAFLTAQAGESGVRVHQVVTPGFLVDYVDAWAYGDTGDLAHFLSAVDALTGRHRTVRARPGTLPVVRRRQPLAVAA